MLLTVPRRGWLVLFVALAFAITALALVPKPPASASLGWDKLNHVAAFMALAWCARGAWPDGRWSVLWGALLAYGAGLEMAQGMTPNRQAEAADVLADLLGVALAQAAQAGWHGIQVSARRRSSRAGSSAGAKAKG